MAQDPEIDGAERILVYKKGIQKRKEFLAQNTERRDFGDYLDPQNSNEVEALCGKHPLILDILFQLMRQSFIYMKNQTQIGDDIRELFCLESLTNDNRFLPHDRNPYCIFDIVSYLRASSILLAEKRVMTPKEFSDHLKKYIPAIIGEMYLDEDLEIPQSISFLIGRNGLLELGKMKIKGIERIGRGAMIDLQLKETRDQILAEALENGTHEKFAKRKADVATEHALVLKKVELVQKHESAQKELDDFLIEFPDPRTVIYLLLETDDDSCPLDTAGQTTTGDSRNAFSNTSVERSRG